MAPSPAVGRKQALLLAQGVRGLKEDVGGPRVGPSDKLPVVGVLRRRRIDQSLKLFTDARVAVRPRPDGLAQMRATIAMNSG